MRQLSSIVDTEKFDPPGVIVYSNVISLIIVAGKLETSGADGRRVGNVGLESMKRHSIRREHYAPVD